MTNRLFELTVRTARLACAGQGLGRAIVLTRDIWVLLIGMTFVICSQSAAWAAKPLVIFDDARSQVCRQVIFLDNGKIVVSNFSDVQKKGFRLWEVATGKEKTAVECGFSGEPALITASQDGKLIAACGSSKPPAGSDFAPGKDVKIYDLTAGKFVLTFQLDPSQTGYAAITPDNKFFVVEDRRGGAAFYDLKTGKESFRLDGQEKVCCIALSPDGKWLAIGDTTGGIWIWDVETRKHKSTLGGFGGVLALTFSPDSKTLACGNDNRTVSLWDFAKEQQGNVVKVKIREGDALAFSPDGKTLAISGNAGTVYLWNGSAEKFDETTTIEVAKLTDISSLAFSPDGKLLAVGLATKSVPVYEIPLKAK